MDGYAVKVDELGKLIGDLDTAAGRMADANKKLGGGGAFGSLGDPELGKAGVEFEEAWRYGIGRIGDAASEITERLKQAKQKYEQIEAQFSGELGKFGSAVFGDGPAGPGEPGGAKGNHPGLGRPDEGPVGGGYTGGVPGIGGLTERTDPGADLGDGGMVGGGVTGGVPGINDQAGRDGRPVGGGIADILNGLDR
ncbi:hypothetical protein [Amycolatopsis australiensis]|uniref:Excreted virulence factor EspC, type VII ESX diderm n=1 Tax=Amycolatopsis australiensis TaxID=546364 RepID=A0A1K1QCI5_9PSEU|nr:hypothetical protein [Amycolatopsis australiensis]SFW57640.1 hypothetical protein SAMN04489730_1634 [Amycolatopsis australiensis]